MAATKNKSKGGKPAQRTRAQKKRDLFLTAQLYLQRKTQAEIASELKITQQQVSLDLKALHEDWAKQRATLVDQKINEDLIRIDEQERQYWQGWADSRVPRTERTIDPDKGVIIKTITSAGDPRFLDGIGKCVAQRQELLGVLTKRKIGASGATSPMRLPITGVVVHLPTGDGIDADLEFGEAAA